MQLPGYSPVAAGGHAEALPTGLQRFSASGPGHSTPVHQTSAGAGLPACAPSLTPDSPSTLAALEASCQSHEEQLPRASWTERDGHVWVHGIGHVPGGKGIARVPYAEQIEGFVCQPPGCCQSYARPEVALWRRYESGLGRRMYWLSLAADAPKRSRCDRCEVSP